MAEPISGSEERSFERSSERRPAVRILVCDAGARQIEPILWGLEEEGVPPEVEQVAEGETVALARQAAQMSTLNVGIAVNAREDRVVLHHRDLAAHPPLFSISLRQASPLSLRLLGSNAARLVKASPLLLEEERARQERRRQTVAARVARGNGQGAADASAAAASIGAEKGDEELLEAIVRAVLELLAK